MATEFDTTEYEFSHGCKPRGRGSWAFAPLAVRPGPWSFPSEGMAWVKGTYTEAKRDIRREYPTVQVWQVLP